MIMPRIHGLFVGLNGNAIAAEFLQSCLKSLFQVSHSLVTGFQRKYKLSPLLIFVDHILVIPISDEAIEANVIPFVSSHHLCNQDYKLTSFLNSCMGRCR